MSVLDSILNELDEAYVVKNITGKHDEARLQYALKQNTVPDDAAFDQVIGEYYNYHFARCFSGGGPLPRREAAGRAKELLFDEYRRRHQGKDKLYA